MGLYERLLGRDEDGNPVHDAIPPRVFMCVVAEFAMGEIQGSDARALLASMRCELTDSEEQEAAALLGTITGTAQQKVFRWLEIGNVLDIGRQGGVGYARPADVKARLGV